MPTTTSLGDPPLAIGGAHRFESRLALPCPIQQVFAFFADAGNLERLTPPTLRFRILTPRPIEMGVGTIIDYRLRVRGVPIRWRTRITSWDPPFRFADFQERGPYRLWHHEHHFESLPDGTTLCRDRVDYAHAGGRLVHRLLVRPDIERIFAFRERTLRELFA